jgi:condensin complex subunit 2
MRQEAKKSTNNKRKKETRVQTDEETEEEEIKTFESMDEEDVNYDHESQMEGGNREEIDEFKARPNKKRRISSISSSGTPQRYAQIAQNQMAPNNRRTSILFSSPISNEPLNDDEQEKRENKKRREQERRRRSAFASNVQFISATSGRNPIDSSSNNTQSEENRAGNATHTLSSSQLEDLFKNCIKLSTENKINVKNTWSLNLIDYIDEVITSSTVGKNEVSNFQVASCTLDASVKIYSCRVDSVHSDAYKVLGGLSRADAKKQIEEEQTEEIENENEDGVSNDDSNKRSVKKKQHGASTLESNISNLNLKKFEHAYSIEPLYYKTSGNSAHYDVGSAESLLLNNLYMSQSSELILDSAKYNYALELIPLENIATEDVTALEKDIGIVSTQVQEMECDEDDNIDSINGIAYNTSHPALSKNTPIEHYGNAQSQPLPTNLESNEKQVQSPQIAIFSKDLIETAVIQSNGENESFGCGGGEIGFDDLLEDGDDSDAEECLLDVGFNNIDMEEEIREGEVGAALSNEEGQWSKNTELPIFVSEQIDLDNDYRFINHNKIKGNNWAGANYWTFISTKSKKNLKSSSKGKKAMKMIDFLTEPWQISKKAFEIDSSEKKSSISMANKTIKAAEKKNHLLPEDVHYDIISIEKAFALPNLSLMSRDSSIANMVAGEERRQQQLKLSELNKIEDDDEADIGFGGDVGFDDGDFADGYAAKASSTTDVNGEHRELSIANDLPAPATAAISAQAVDGEQLELVRVPHLVEKLDIKYTTRAKKIDVKALKDHLWESISHNTDSNETKQFSAVVNSLSETRNGGKSSQTKKSKPDFSDVSVPFCFICLLHLANEKGLEITGKQDLSDLSIMYKN